MFRVSVNETRCKWFLARLLFFLFYSVAVACNGSDSDFLLVHVSHLLACVTSQQQTRKVHCFSDGLKCVGWMGQFIVCMAVDSEVTG